MLENDYNPHLDPAMGALFDFRISKGEAKQGEIILATIDCLSQYGIENISYSAIAKKIGSTKSHVTYYFKNKDDIYLEVYRYIAATYQSYTIAELDETSHPAQMLWSFIDAYFKWCQENTKQLNVMFLLYDFCFRKEKFRQLNQKIRDGGVERISYILLNYLEVNFTRQKTKSCARAIQAIMSHAAVDAFTMNLSEVEKSKRIKDAYYAIEVLLGIKHYARLQ